jgi:hypothetical protein
MIIKKNTFSTLILKFFRQFEIQLLDIENPKSQNSILHNVQSKFYCDWNASQQSLPHKYNFTRAPSEWTTLLVVCRFAASLSMLMIRKSLSLIRSQTALAISGPSDVAKAQLTFWTLFKAEMKLYSKWTFLFCVLEYVSYWTFIENRHELIIFGNCFSTSFLALQKPNFLKSLL